MARIGSFIRFFIGLALSIEVLRDVIMGIPLSEIAIALSAAFIVLSIAFLVFRF